MANLSFDVHDYVVLITGADLRIDGGYTAI